MLTTKRKEPHEMLGPEQRLFSAEQTYGYTVVHAFDYCGHRFEIRKIVENKDAQKEKVIFGVHAEDGTAHVRIDGQLSCENVFTMEYGTNYKLELRRTPVKQAGHIPHLAATVVGQLATRVITVWCSDTRQSLGDRRVYDEFLQTDPYWKEQVQVDTQDLPLVGTRSVVTRRKEAVGSETAENSLTASKLARSTQLQDVPMSENVPALQARTTGACLDQQAEGENS